MESIEKDYVLVNSHFALMDDFSCYVDTSLQNNSTTKFSICPSKKNDNIAIAVPTKDLPCGSASGAESSQFNASFPLETSNRFSISKEVQGLAVLHPSTKLQLLHQYVHALAELAEEKNHFQLSWLFWLRGRRPFQCGSWLTSTSRSELPATCSANKRPLVPGGTSSAPNLENNVDFGSLSSVCTWAEQEFVLASDRAEKLSYNIRGDTDGAAEMPDTMEVIYQKHSLAQKLWLLKSIWRTRSFASALYSKAMLMLSFLVRDAASLQLYPPFSLTPSDDKRIQSYNHNFQSRQS